MLRALVGLVKGLVLSGAIAYGFLAIGWTGGPATYLACILAGALAGVACGQPPWKAETIWTPVVKMIFGAAVGAGLAALGRQAFVPEFALPKVGALALGSTHGPLLAAAVGALYGLFVEVDDGGKSDDKKEKEAAAKPLPAKRK